MFGHAVVRPGCELEVTNLTLLIGAALDMQKDKRVKSVVYLNEMNVLTADDG